MTGKVKCWCSAGSDIHARTNIYFIISRLYIVPRANINHQAHSSPANLPLG
jgi:hypothetical protein